MLVLTDMDLHGRFLFVYAEPEQSDLGTLRPVLSLRYLTVTSKRLTPTVLFILIVVYSLGANKSIQFNSSRKSS